MKQKIIRLTETDLHNIIKKCCAKMLQEYDSYDDIEDFSDDENTTEQETIWWSPLKGFARKPTNDTSFWCYVTLEVEYSYQSDGQMTDFGWHEDGKSIPVSCEVIDMICYNVNGDSKEECTEDLSDDEYQQYVTDIENSYLSE